MTSDHGESLGEEGVVGHGHLGEEELRVPLVMHVPGIAPAIVDEPVQLADVLPTVLAHLRLGEPGPLDGVDLLPIMRGTATFGGRRLRISWNGAGEVAIRTDQRWKLVVDQKTSARRLYDLETDPRWDGADAHPEIADAIAAAWRDALGDTERTPRPNRTSKRLDPALKDRLRALGYLD